MLWHWDNIPPTLVSAVFTLTTKGIVGPVCPFFQSRNTLVADSDHWRVLRLLLTVEVRDVVIE